MTIEEFKSIERRERAERSRRELRDAGIKMADSFTDLAFSLERFQVALDKANLNADAD